MYFRTCVTRYELLYVCFYPLLCKIFKCFDLVLIFKICLRRTVNSYRKYNVLITGQLIISETRFHNYWRRMCLKKTYIIHRRNINYTQQNNSEGSRVSSAHPGSRAWSKNKNVSTSFSIYCVLRLKACYNGRRESWC